MSRRLLHRNGCRLLAALLLLLGPCGVATAEQVQGPSELVFPVQGEHRILDGFGSARARGRLHEGLDIGAAAMTPVVAVAAGTVESLQDTHDGPCCSITLRHDDGWQSRYLHLNDDDSRKDGRVVGIAAALQPGSHVTAGEIIGWVGDSGNATTPHLHFELLQPDGTAVDPAPYLPQGPSHGSAPVASATMLRYWRALLVTLLVAATLMVRQQAAGSEASR